MLISRGEYCLFADADGATRFSDLEKLEAELGRWVGGRDNVLRRVTIWIKA
jgi:dolichyl-phosphate beta-glucosyltransferase